MSSVQSGYAQIPRRSKYLYAVLPGSGFTQLKLDNTIAARSTSVLMYDGTILNTTNASTFVGYINAGRPYLIKEMFRDLGKTLYIQTQGRNDYIFTYVQSVNGATTEGVPKDYNVNSTTTGNFWLCTWVAEDNPGASPPVTVVRTG